MVWCDFCGRNCERPQFDNGYLCCSLCGKVILEDNFSNEPTFMKNAAGQSQMSGHVVRSVQGDYSRERTVKAAYDNMKNVTTSLHMDDGEAIINPALAFYRIAVERNFTRGRKRELVEAACLYIACRDLNKPFLLIDFSEHLKVNVYVLGATFLQLCKLLSLEENPLVQKPVDPSLFMHRFANCLVGQNYMGVSRTATKIIASMKRDWMQTGRKPSGLCGAALYISALSHGLKYSKSDIIRIVHICEATLTKRLIEFENTESGSLTIEEFNLKAGELDKESSKKQSDSGVKLSGISELLCEHKDSGISPFAHGLCKTCYDDFIELSGGLEGGSEPPAFQRAERERMVNKSAEGNGDDSNFVIKPSQGPNSKHLNFEKEPNIQEASRKEKVQFTEPIGDVSGSATERVNDIEGAFDKSQGVDGMGTKGFDESESLSDIDDVEVDSYLHNEEEQRYKKIIWEEMNKEYMEEQAAKEAAAAAAKEAYMAKFQNCSPEDMQAAQELAAAAAAAVAKARKERQQKRAAEAKNSTPAQTAAEATRQMLTKKRLSSKINYDVLDKLFEESEPPEKPKKSRSESPSKNEDNPPSISKNKLETEELQEDGDLGDKDDFEDLGDVEGAYGNDYYDNAEAYDYDDNYGDDEY